MASNKDIPMGYNNSLIQQALQDGDAGIAAQRQAGMNTINESQQQMYDMLGRMQLQQERQIADQRIAALRSGQTSSQLAAMEMQNLQAGQIGATSILQDARNQRLALEQEFAGKKDMNRYYMLEMLNQNIKDSSAIDAQKFAASGAMQAAEALGSSDPELVLRYINAMTGNELDSSALKAIQEILNPTTKKNEVKSKTKETAQVDAEYEAVQSLFE